MESPSQSYGASPAVWDHTVYLPPDTSERARLKNQPDRLVLDLPTPEGWKIELT